MLLRVQVKRSLLWMEDRARSAAANTAAGRWGVVDSDLGERPDEEVDGQLVEVRGWGAFVCVRRVFGDG